MTLDTSRRRQKPLNRNRGHQRVLDKHDSLHAAFAQNLYAFSAHVHQLDVDGLTHTQAGLPEQSEE